MRILCQLGDPHFWNIHHYAPSKVFWKYIKNILRVLYQKEIKEIHISMSNLFLYLKIRGDLFNSGLFVNNISYIFYWSVTDTKGKETG